MLSHDHARARPCPCAAVRDGGRLGDDLPRAVRLRLERLFGRGRAGVRRADLGACVALPQLAPAYGGSLELRAPFALLPGLWGGGEVAVYRAVSMACLIAAAVFAVWLLARMRALGRDRLARATAIGLCVANPVTLYALQFGHAEELLGAVLCVAAVLAAQRGRAGWSGVLLGLAIANKQWGLLAIGPVLRRAARRTACVRCSTRARSRRPSTCRCGCRASSAEPSRGAARRAAPAAATIFQPWQLWWFLGSHGHTVVGGFGVLKPGYRTPPGVDREHPPPADRRARRAGDRARLASRGVATRCCCSPSSSRCASRWTRGTPSTTRCPSSSPCWPGRPSTGGARRCSRSSPA